MLNDKLPVESSSLWPQLPIYSLLTTLKTKGLYKGIIDKCFYKSKKEITCLIASFIKNVFNNKDLSNWIL